MNLIELIVGALAVSAAGFVGLAILGWAERRREDQP